MLNSANTTYLMNESYDKRAHEVVKLVRKLRWIGEHEKARELQRNLPLSERPECVLAGPSDTD